MRRLDIMFPGYFPGAKHNHYVDFGYPTLVDFNLCYETYTRNSIAKAAVTKTVAKTWESHPLLQEKARDAGKPKPETRREALIRQWFDDLRFWQQLMECDRRALVGSYSGVILQMADGKNWDQPVGTVAGGLDGLVKVIPAWEGQLSVSQWDEDQASRTYGEPLMYSFQEAAVGQQQKPRSVMIHRDRVVIWSEDGTLNCRSALEAGINDLIDIEKVRGGGAEGFWKNAKSSPILETIPGASLTQMATAMGVKPEDVVDKMNDQVEGWQQGFDKLLMLQGMTAKALAVTLPASPEQFYLIAVMGFAASFMIPMKILIGSQSGERASTEDAGEWARTNMARRMNIVIPAIMAVIRRLERFNILPKRDWHLDWADLTAANDDQKIDRVTKMTTANKTQSDATGERVYTVEEIRAIDGKEPLSEADAKVEKPDDGNDDPNKTDPAKPGDPAKPPAKAAA